MSSVAFAACGNYSGEGERYSGRYRKVFGFVTGTAFTLPPESRSPSHRNAVRLPTGIAFGFDRIPQFAWVVSLERAFLLSIALKHGRIQIQAVTLGSSWQALDLPLREGRIELMNFSHAKAPKQIADRVIGRKARDAEQCM